MSSLSAFKICFVTQEEWENGSVAFKALPYTWSGHFWVSHLGLGITVFTIWTAFTIWRFLQYFLAWLNAVLLC